MKVSSAATKLRVAFDGSAKTTSGVSLNDRLMVGPNLREDLLFILTRFRFHLVALSADIAKMYRQVELDDEDRVYHRILWREPNSQDVKIYKMTRVTYGIASPASYSIRPLQVLGEELDDKNTQLSILSEMYVDDLLTGAADMESASKLQDILISNLSLPGFDIRKCTSSNAELVEQKHCKLTINSR